MICLRSYLVLYVIKITRVKVTCVTRTWNEVRILSIENIFTALGRFKRLIIVTVHENNQLLCHISIFKQ
jgi:hypothetical protein